MRLPILMMILAGTMLASGTAFAGDECNAPMSAWKPRDAVIAKARARGWTVRRIRTDDGCYKVYGTDENGRKIVAEFDPSTLAIVELSTDDSDRKDRDKGSAHRAHD